MTTHDDKFPAKLFRSSRMQRGKQNENGLTFPRWLAAARFGGGTARTRCEVRILRQAWEDGVDPTEMGQ